MSLDMFAERLAGVRKKKGLTLKEVSSETGISVSALSHYLSGVNIPPLDVAVKLAKFFEVSLDWLCGANDGYEEHSAIGVSSRPAELAITNAIIKSANNLRNAISIGDSDEQISAVSEVLFKLTDALKIWFP